MLEHQFEVLEQVRQGKIPWEDYRCEEQVSPDGTACDENAGKRNRLLLALQYNHQDSDEALLAYLLKETVAQHSHSNMQGLGDELKLNAFLLSRFRNPVHAQLFWQAKTANFDTRSGFDIEAILSAGIEATYAHLGNVDFEGKKELMNCVGKTAASCHWDEEELDEWREGMSSYFPDKLVLDSLEDEVRFAIELDDKAILGEKIAQWKQEQSSWSEENYNQLYWWERYAGNAEGQIWAKIHELEMLQEPKEKASALLTLTELQLEMGDGEAAWEQIQLAIPELKLVKDWQQIGLGRFFLECAFEVVLKVQAMNQIMAHMAYEWAIEEVPSLERLHLNLLEKAADAALLMMDTESAERFQQTLKRKREALKNL